MAKKFTSKQEVIEYLQTLPFNALIDTAADAILELQTRTCSKIIISEEQFNAYFRVKGFKENGEKENRGRQKGQTWKRNEEDLSEGLFEEN